MAALCAGVAVSAENQPKPAKKTRRRRPRFWVGPLVAGGCFTLGFGVTQRLIAMQGGAASPKPQTFEQQSFPGESLEALRARYPDHTRPLKADVAAREAELALTRPAKPKPEVKAIARREPDRKPPLAPVMAVPEAPTLPEQVELMPAPQLPVEAEAELEPFDPASSPLPEPVLLEADAMPMPGPEPFPQELSPFVDRQLAPAPYALPAMEPLVLPPNP